MNAATMWAGEGNETRTACTPSLSLLTEDIRFVPMFRSYDDWELACGGPIDAPVYIAIGGIRSHEMPHGSVVMFASERRL